MGFGDRNKRPRGGRRTAAFLASFLSILLAATFFSFYLAANTGSAVIAAVAESEFLTGADLLGHQLAEAGEKQAVEFREPDEAGELPSEITLAGAQPASVRFDKETDVPAFMTGSFDVPAGASILESAVAFFDDNIDLFRMSDPAAEFAVEREEADDVGMTHLHLAQQYQGVPVFASDMSVHFSADGKISAVNGRYVPDISLDPDPGITVEAAIAAAQQDLGYLAPSSDHEPPLLTILAPAGGERQLTWKITLAMDDPPLRMVYFIDAHTGKVAAGYSDLEAARNRNTYTAGNGTSTPGTLLITEGGSSGDSVAQNAHNHIGATYDYYFSVFGRDSYNDAGAQLTSTVHYGSSYNNAYWNGVQMVYGDGDGYVFSPLGNSQDVVAHELTHGVTQQTAGLVYSYQSGALNESYSDVFGVMVDRDDWLLGEDVYTPGTAGDALRSMSNPEQFGQPAHMNNYVNTDSDNGGVHTNSGIPNKAAYNLAVAIGREKTERIWYRTLTLYLNSGSQFNDARDASVQAAADLYGPASPEVTATQSAFTAVGIGGATVSDTMARVEVDHSYRGDLVVTVGVGDPNNPLWSTVVSNRTGGSSDNVYANVDIAGGAAYLPPSWQNRWFLKVYDSAGYDQGTIRKFSITDHGTTYTATDVPMPVEDYVTAISFIPTSDNTPPTVQSTAPVSGASGYATDSISAVFSEEMMASTLTADTFTLRPLGDPAALPAGISYDPASHAAVLDPVSDLAYSTTYEATINAAVTDGAGNPLGQSHTWSFTTMPEPKNYYFTWYDQQSIGMRDWLMMATPSSQTEAASFDVSVGGAQRLSVPLAVNPNQTTALSFPGLMGGPVIVSQREGASAIVSKRTLYGDSLEEINGLEMDKLTSRYYFTWYDAQSPGSRNWILVANPGVTPLQADIYIAGQKMNPVPYQIAPGGSVTPEFPGMMGGPVEVVGYEPGDSLMPRNIVATQRVLWNGNFNEAIGIPANGLSNDYLFTWYDQRSPGARTWVLVGNPDQNNSLAVEITMAGQKMTNAASGDQYFLIEPGGSMTPTFPGALSGPVEVKGYNAESFNPANPGIANMNFYTSQRSLFGSSFGEISGFPRVQLTPQYFFTWYDQATAGASDWVLVTNPGNESVVTEIWIGGYLVKSLTIAPGETQTPTFPGLASGPVEVRGYDAASYDPQNPGAPNRNIFTSQRVMWKGHFNEVEGMDLS